MEALGTAIIGLSHNLHEEFTRPVFAKHGLDVDHLDPDEWYPAYLINEIYKEVYANGRGASTLVAFGKASAVFGISLTNPNNVDELLAAINEPILVSLRNQPQEYGLIVEKVDEKTYHVKNNTDSPNDLVYGCLWESLRLLMKENEDFELLPLENHEAGSEHGATYKISVDIS